MEFTKGEWKQRQLFESPNFTTFKDGTECYHNEINIHDNTGRIIASVNYSTDTPNMGWGRNETIVKWKANAQLIANAPKMLEMLQLTVIELESGAKGHWEITGMIKELINQATKIDQRDTDRHTEHRDESQSSRGVYLSGERCKS